MNNVLQFEGDIRMSIIGALGALTAVVPSTTDPFGNLPVEVSASVFNYEAGDELKVVTKGRDRYNQTIYADTQPGESGLSLTFVAIPPSLLARVYYGEAAEVAVAASAVTDEPITVTAKAVPLALPHRYLVASPAPVVKDASGVTTYVDGTDYTIDLMRGLITVKTGSAILVDDVIEVSYTKEAYNLTSIRGGVKPTENFYITGDMKNRPGSQDMELEIYQANLATDGDVDLFSDEPITITLAGKLITPTGKTEPYVAKWFQKTA